MDDKNPLAEYNALVQFGTIPNNDQPLLSDHARCEIQNMTIAGATGAASAIAFSNAGGNYIHWTCWPSCRDYRLSNISELA